MISRVPSWLSDVGSVFRRIDRLEMGIRAEFFGMIFSLGENLTKWLFTRVNALVRKDISTLDEGLVTESEV